MTPDMILSIAAGGAIGATARHLLNILVGATLGTDFPYHTLVANVSGSLVMGLLVELMALVWEPSQVLRAFLTVGLLGGYTTFSSFSLDSAVLIESGQFGAAAVYVLTSVVGSIGGLFSGLWIGRLIAG